MQRKTNIAKVFFGGGVQPAFFGGLNEMFLGPFQLKYGHYGAT
jgi:hypothetical protein